MIICLCPSVCRSILLLWISRIRSYFSHHFKSPLFLLHKYISVAEHCLVVRNNERLTERIRKFRFILWPSIPLHLRARFKQRRNPQPATLYSCMHFCKIGYVLVCIDIWTLINKGNITGDKGNLIRSICRNHQFTLIRVRQWVCVC